MNMWMLRLLAAGIITFQPLSAQQIRGWMLSDDDYDKSKISKLRDRVSDQTYKKINSVIVIKNGKLLVEEYYNGAHRDSTHDPRSVSKTLTGSILGIAIQEGYIRSISQTLSEFFDLSQYDHQDPKKASVSLTNLLTMSSGFDGFDFDENSIGNEENMYPQDNWVTWTLNLPMAADRNPGDQWFYFTAGIVVLGDILNQKVPGGLIAYTDEKLFKPLGIRDYRWQYTPQGVGNTAGGLQLTPLDFAKFGQLYKNGGRWNGNQILPKTWVDESFQKYYKTVVTGNSYGYLWWNKTYTVGEKSYEVFYCTGNGGNKIFVFKDQPLVIVVTASAYGQRYAHSQVDEMMEKYILPAVVK